MKYTLLQNKETKERSIRINSTGTIVTELDQPKEYKELRKKAIKAIERKQKDQFMKDCGLTKVRGAVSGKIYWE
jgi:hypothetical protein